MDISERKIKDNVNYILKGAKHIIETFGRRGPGDEGEVNAQLFMADELKKFSDKVVTEEFEVRPTAFMGWISISCTFLIMSMILYFFYPLVSLILIILGVLCMVFEFVMYKRFVDFLFQKKTSMNVYASRKPEGEVKRRIVFNGHSDAAFEWHWHYKYGFKGLAILVIGVALALLYNLGIVIATIAANGLQAPTHYEMLFLVLGILQIVFLPFIIAMYFFSDNNKVVPGANDNLSAAYMSIAIMKLLKEENITFNNTEVCCLITGSEEAGLRGAKVWAKKHKDTMQRVETAFVVFETLKDVKYLSIYNKDLNGTVRNDAALSKLIKDAGENNGVNMKYGTVTLGSTDSAAFSQEGLTSTAIAAMNPVIERYYHTRLDNYDNMGPECLEKVLKISLDTLEMFDRDGLPIL